MEKFLKIVDDKLTKNGFSKDEINIKIESLKKCLSDTDITENILLMIPPVELNTIVNDTLKTSKLRIDVVKNKEGSHQYKIFGISPDDKNVHSILKETFGCRFIRSEGGYWSCFLNYAYFDMKGFVQSNLSLDKKSESKNKKSESKTKLESKNKSVSISEIIIERIPGKKSGTYQYKIHGVSSNNKSAQSKLKAQGCRFLKTNQGSYWSCFSSNPSLTFQF